MKDYWRKRQAQHIEDILSKADVSNKQIAGIYAKSSFYLNEQIQGIYDRYKKKHSLSDVEAKALLNEMNDSADYEEMLKRLHNGAKNEERKQLLKELEAPAYRYRINKLQKTQEMVDTLMQSVYSQEKEINTLNYINTAYDAYYKSIYNLQQGTGLAFSFDDLDPELVDKLLKLKWSGKNYSTRIWNNAQAVADSLKEEMLLGVLTGKTEKEMAQTITYRFLVGAYQARRLTNTESTFICNALDMAAYKEADVEKVRFCAVHDMKTSKICQQHDRKVIDIDKAVQGVNVPPMHPNCRSTIEPVIDKVIEAKMKRRTRNPVTGKEEIVNANETYEQWLKRIQKDNGIETVDMLQKKLTNLSSDKKQYRNYISIIGKENMPESIAKFQDMKYNNTPEWNLLKKYKRSRSSGKLSAFSTFEDYKKYRDIIQNKIVGIKTEDGIEIKAQSDHFIERVLGTTVKEDRNKSVKREGVDIEDIINALSGKAVSTKIGPNGKSSKYSNDRVEVNINPDTGILINVVRREI